MQTKHLNTVVFLILNFCLLSCGGGNEKNTEQSVTVAELISGDWSVQWVTYPERGVPIIDSINYTMNGRMKIEETGKIMISVFGYKNCIFGGDTLIHTLNWEIKQDTILNLTNEGDKFGIPYTIIELSTDKARLKLVEDVYLFLIK